jgi:alkanesulfonate monooxygenase SsuD/methylene tetrahydromethanopterin reductase-like flavin-dependent oxidoreductase (luciferase family)
VSTLDELSDGRAGLGIGAGEAMNIEPFGLKWEKPSVRVERLKEAVQVVKLLWGSSRDNPVDFEGIHYQLNKAWLDHKPLQHPHPPVYIGALGNERTLEVAGEVGDGWLPWISCPESWKERLEIVRRGAEKAKRSLEDLDLCVWMYLTMSREEKAYQEAIKQLKQTLLVDRYHLKMFGYDLPLPIDYSYQRLKATKKAQETILEAAKHIPDELIEKKFIPIGGADEIIETISTYLKMGATHICVKDICLSAEEGFKQFSNKVISYFKD